MPAVPIQTNALAQMEAVNFVPGQARHRYQRGNEVELARACRDDAGVARPVELGDSGLDLSATKVAARLPSSADPGATSTVRAFARSSMK